MTAFLWANLPVSDALMFNVATTTALAHNNTTVENARLFALLYMAYHDALETTFTSQFTYGFWRPETATRRAGEVGNADTTADTNWNSLIPAPPHPSYPSAASTVSASLATTLALFYERDDVQFQINFGGSPNVIRSYSSFSALTNEISRVFGGVHFPTDTGQSAGRSVANYVFLNYLTPRRRNL